MTTTDGSAENADQDVQAIREALAATVGALAEKTEMPAQKFRDVDRVKQQPVLIAAAVGFVFISAVIIIRRMRRTTAAGGAR